jgi:hypothetical protein
VSASAPLGPESDSAHACVSVGAPSAVAFSPPCVQFDCEPRMAPLITLQKVRPRSREVRARRKPGLSARRGSQPGCGGPAPRRSRSLVHRNPGTLRRPSRKPRATPSRKLEWSGGIRDRPIEWLQSCSATLRWAAEPGRRHLPLARREPGYGLEGPCSRYHLSILLRCSEARMGRSTPAPPI